MTDPLANPLGDLGDFAVFLSDDPLPIRPSAAAEEAAAAAEIAHLNPRRFSPSKEEPAWKFGKPKYPRIKRKTQEGMENVDDIKLPCGNCDCHECKLTYRSYWEEKTFSKELNQALLDERKAMQSVVEEVGKLEADYSDQISKLKLEIDIVNEKNQNMEANLEFERKLRADETYRREVTNEESKHLYEQSSALERKLVAYSEELTYLRGENEALREATDRSRQLREKTLSEVRKYESMTNALERDNAEVKTSLYQAEIEINQLKLSRDNLKARLNSVTDFYGNPTKKQSLQSSSTSALSLAVQDFKPSKSLSKITRELKVDDRSPIRKQNPRANDSLLGGSTLSSLGDLR